jgi:hypothetical protein
VFRKPEGRPQLRCCRQQCSSSGMGYSTACRGLGGTKGSTLGEVGGQCKQPDSSIHQLPRHPHAVQCDYSMIATQRRWCPLQHALGALPPFKAGTKPARHAAHARDSSIHRRNKWQAKQACQSIIARGLFNPASGRCAWLGVVPSRGPGMAQP